MVLSHLSNNIIYQLANMKHIVITIMLLISTGQVIAQGYKRPESYNYQRGVEAIQNENLEEALEYLNPQIRNL